MITTPRKKMKIFELTVRDETGFLRSRWFNQPYLKKIFSEGPESHIKRGRKGQSIYGFRS